MYIYMYIYMLNTCAHMYTYTYIYKTYMSILGVIPNYFALGNLDNSLHCLYCVFIYMYTNMAGNLCIGSHDTMLVPLRLHQKYGFGWSKIQFGCSLIHNTAIFTANLYL
jgi:hypothetical protein